MAPPALEPSLVRNYDVKGITALAINRAGTHTMLASRRGLHLVNLDAAKDEVARVLPTPAKYDVANLDWNPHSGKDSMLASPSNQNCLVWDVNASKPLVSTLRIHTRVVNDVRWSPFDDARLATCAADTYLHIWDTRRPKKPAQSYCAWTAAATHVRWNRHNPFIIASAHDGEVRLWDLRQPVSPVSFITAHMAKISGMDWSHSEEDKLVTCSQDKEVKFWSVRAPRQAQTSMSLVAPPSSVRFAPFGDSGVLVMPQRSSPAITLWNHKDLTEPLASFKFNEDAVRSINIRTQEIPDGKAYKLLTCTKEGLMEEWQVPLDAQRACGRTVEVTIKGLDSHTGSMDELSIGDISSGVLEEQDDTELGRELASVVKANWAGVLITQVDFKQRKCDLVIEGERAAWSLRVQLTFPDNYPDTEAPVLSILPGSSYPPQLISKALDVLNELAKSLVDTGQACLAGLCGSARTHLVRLKDQEDDASQHGAKEEAAEAKKSKHRPAAGSGSEHSGDKGVVPVPRLSGVSWTLDGHLAIFHTYSAGTLSMISTPPREFAELVRYVRESERMDAEQQFGTQPEALLDHQASQIPSLPRGPGGDMLGDILGDAPSFDNDPQNVGLTMAPKTLLSHNTLSQQSLNSTINFVDLSSILPLSYGLASLYQTGMDGQFTSACISNAHVAHAANKPRIAQTWQMLSQICNIINAGRSETLSPSYIPLSIYPLGRDMIKSIFEHYIKLRDVQTLAMLTTVIRNVERSLASHILPFPNNDVEETPRLTSIPRRGPFASSGSLVDEADSASIGQDTVMAPRSPLQTTRFRALSSASASVSPSRGGPAPPDRSGVEDHRLIPESFEDYCDNFCIIYADILLRLELLEARVEVLNAVKRRPFGPAAESDVSTTCKSCGNPLSGPRCAVCRSTSLLCSICELSVRGLAHQCPLCGHGGHASHLMDWFLEHRDCPTGCGCRCIYPADSSESPVATTPTSTSTATTAPGTGLGAGVDSELALGFHPFQDEEGSGSSSYALPHSGPFGLPEPPDGFPFPGAIGI